MLNLTEEDLEKIAKRAETSKKNEGLSPYEIERRQFLEATIEESVKNNSSAYEVIEKDADANESSDFVDVVNEIVEKTKPDVTEDDDNEIVEDTSTQNTVSEKEKLRQELLAEIEASKKTNDHLSARELELRNKEEALAQAYANIVKAQQEQERKELEKQALAKLVAENAEKEKSKQSKLADLKARAKSLANKMVTEQDESAGDELGELLYEIQNSNAPQVDIEKLVEEKLNKRLAEENSKREAEKAKSLEIKFIAARDVFFESNKEILENPRLRKLFKANFDELQNSGEPLTPEALFKKAKESFDQDLIELGIKGVQKKDTTPKVEENLQRKVQENMEAKNNVGKQSSASKNERSTVNTVAKTQQELYEEMLAKQGKSFK